MSRASKFDQEMLDRGFLRVLVAREISGIAQTTIYRWIRQLEVESEDRGSCTYIRISSLAARLDPTAREQLEQALNSQYGNKVSNLTRIIAQPRNDGCGAT